jgi:serine/threonine protein kinase
MTAERSEEWRRVKKIFQDALAKPAEQREAFVLESCRGDHAIRDEVLSLLNSHEEAGAFLEAPAVSVRGVEHGELASTEVPDPNIGRVVGSYYIESLIGHGGMGAVYLGRRADQAFERRVAIKMIRRGMDAERLIPRFRHERQILASLEHPNIAQLLDGGTTDEGVPYLVMELVQGSRIDAYCDERRLSVPERLRLFRQVCEPVQYAHQRLVIHRDLKPANILVQDDGVPKLLDFGIAKLLDQASGFETTLAPAMTPAYASPEQVRGESITTASDVYSLGVVLYQLLTGRSPYPGDTRSSLELARAVCDTEPDRPSAVVRRLAGDLDHIVLKALRKEPQERYQSVEQFSEDIRRHLERLPIIARKGSLRYRAGKFTARHRIAVAAAAIVLFAIVGGTIATARQARIGGCRLRLREPSARGRRSASTTSASSRTRCSSSCMIRSRICLGPPPLASCSSSGRSSISTASRRNLEGMRHCNVNWPTDTSASATSREDRTPRTSATHPWRSGAMSARCRFVRHSSRRIPARSPT